MRNNKNFVKWDIKQIANFFISSPCHATHWRLRIGDWRNSTYRI